MRDRTPEQLVVGKRALMKNGSPVRQWMCLLGRRSETWLTPVRYTMASKDASQPTAGPKYLEVTIARIMPPFAVVHHHNGHEWVRLWLDLREVGLYAVRK
jgi:hypothetical protein